MVTGKSSDGNETLDNLNQQENVAGDKVDSSSIKSATTKQEESFIEGKVIIKKGEDGKPYISEYQLPETMNEDERGAISAIVGRASAFDKKNNELNKLKEDFAAKIAEIDSKLQHYTSSTGNGNNIEHQERRIRTRDIISELSEATGKTVKDIQLLRENEPEEFENLKDSYLFSKIEAERNETLKATQNSIAIIGKIAKAGYEVEEIVAFQRTHNISDLNSALKLYQQLTPKTPDHSKRDKEAEMQIKITTIPTTGKSAPQRSDTNTGNSNFIANTRGLFDRK